MYSNKILKVFWEENDWIDSKEKLKEEKIIEILKEGSSELTKSNPEKYEIYTETLKFFFKGFYKEKIIHLGSRGIFGSNNFKYRIRTNGPIEDSLGRYLDEGNESNIDKLQKLGEIKRIFELLTDSTIKMKLDRSLEERKVLGIKKLYPLASEKKIENRNLYSITYLADLTDGTQIEIDYKDISSDTEYIVKDRAYIILSEDIKGSLLKTSELNLVGEKEMIVINNNPINSLMPEGTDLSLFDLSKYDLRVQGFERIKKCTLLEIVSSGIEWYKKDEEEFPYILLRDSNGKKIPLPIDEKILGIEQEIKNNIDAKKNAPNAKPFPVAISESNFIDSTNENLITISIGSNLIRQKKKNRSQTDSQASGNLAAIIKEIEHSESPCDIIFEELENEDIKFILNDDIELKQHQIDGLNWLLKSFFTNGGGVILADDMGLGKTLQMISFISILKNIHEIPKLKRFHMDLNSNRPTMIVAPLILLENWKNEFIKFIKEQYRPEILILHGSTLRHISGSGNGLSDPDWFNGFEVVLTNYSTFSKNQTHLLKTKYLVNIFDESQNIKNPDTAQTRAARGLNTHFCICATGTPVENRLLDVWSQVSSLNRKPRNPLGTIDEFKKVEESESCVEKTRELLKMEQQLPILMRRDKNLLIKQGVLKEKIIHAPIEAIMNEFQVQQEKAIIATFKSKPLQVLQNLQKLYQHPALINNSYEGMDTDWLISSSPKLEKTIELLGSIRNRGEKVLIFTLWIGMQAILQKVLSEKFNLDVLVINGESNSKQSQSNNAQITIEKFSKTSGFNILILSPLAAGAGLNITAANNVIHYGRWWNPAKEDQGTDRAYRIGQEKKVNVYYPVLVSQNGESFDLKLHKIVDDKRKLAMDVLHPVADLDIDIEKVTNE